MSPTETMFIVAYDNHTRKNDSIYIQHHVGHWYPITCCMLPQFYLETMMNVPLRPKPKTGKGWPATKSTTGQFKVKVACHFIKYLMFKVLMQDVMKLVLCFMSLVFYSKTIVKINNNHVFPMINHFCGMFSTGVYL